MKLAAWIALPLILLTACETEKAAPPIVGSWRLISGTIIERGDTTVTDYTRDKEFVKVINATHFSFTGHDLNKGKDSAAAFFTAGTGTYTLNDSSYIEHLQYCSAREWEDNKFEFTVIIRNDTLIQKGVEKIAGTNVDRYNIERYVRWK